MTCACRLYIAGKCVWPANEYSCAGAIDANRCEWMRMVGRHQAVVSSRREEEQEPVLELEHDLKQELNLELKHELRLR